MEFHFNINRFFPYSLSKLASNDFRYDGELSRVLDTIGEASRLAQNLNRPVTSAQSFANSNQTLYIITNPDGNSGKGTVLGLLKIGPKKLFLLDKKGAQNELNPVCVLDFYIHESCQRVGLGKLLFDHFLEAENFDVEEIAIDRPSDKFLGFLRKHYGLLNIIPQVNNFVIFDGFFNCGRKSLEPSNSPRLGSNNWNSRITVNQLENEPFEGGRRQTNLSTILSNNENNTNDMWRRNSFADVRPPVDPPFQSQPPAKFTHHRLW